MNREIRCLIVDDEPLAIDILSGYVDQLPQLTLVTTCRSAIEAFEVLQQETIDLIFLDIEMPGLNGLQLAQSLAAKPRVIFTTAYRQYAIEGYELDIVDYLLKPISFERFFKAVSKYIRLTADVGTVEEAAEVKPSGGSIYVYADKKNIKVYLKDILYLESIKDYVRIHTKDKNIVTKGTISHYENLLPSDFLRVHRSYVVNKVAITAYTSHDIEIDAKEIPIGVSYKKAVGEELKAH